MYFMFNTFFFGKNHAVYKEMWIDTVQLDRPQMTIWRMRIACWIRKATKTHSGYVILIAFQCNNGCKKAHHCYIIRTLPVSFVNIGLM